MANIQPLVNYLKINRRARADEAKEINTLVELIDIDYDAVNNATNNTIEVLKADIVNLQGGFQKLTDKITNFSIGDSIYIDVVNTLNNADSIIYYEQDTFDGVVKYREINALDYHELDDSAFLEKSLIYLESVYYYNAETNRIIISNTLDTVFVFPNAFAYNYKDFLPVTNGTFKLDYQDHEGYDNSIGDIALKSAFDGWIKTLIFNSDRKIEVSVSQAIGKVFLYPVISNNNLKYYFVNDTESIAGIKLFNSAIVLKFKYFGALLEFLKQTIFYDNDFDSLTGYKGIKQKFLSDYAFLVNNEINFYRDKIEKVLQILYYTPKAFLYSINNNTLWEIVGKALEGNLTNIDTNKEDIVLNLLETLYQTSKTPTIFLLELLHRKSKDKTSYFYKLFNKMNGENFIKYNNFIKEIWLLTDFADPENEIYNTKKDDSEDLEYDGPIVYPYKSDKTLGIYHSNTDIKWVDNYTKFRVVLETGKYERTGKKTRQGAPAIEEIKIPYTYHPLQPVYIINSDKQKTELKLDYKIPAFYLAATEAKKTVANIYTTIEYTVDVLSTISGVGNLLKLRHITKLTKLGKAIKLARKGAAVIEVTSGTTNALLKLTGVADKKLGAALSEYLFYLEMLSLSVDVTDWISKGLKKSAKEVLEHEDKLLKNLDEIKIEGGNTSRKLTEEEKFRTVLTLEDVAEGGRNLIKSLDELFDISGGKLLTKKELRKLKSFITEKYNVKLRFVDIDHALRTTKTITLKNGKKISKLEDWNRRGVVGSFRAGPPPEFFLRYNYASELTVFHEMIHLKYWFNKKPKIHRIQEEVVVFEEVWKTKKRWTNQELLDSYYYVIRELKKVNLTKDLEKFEGKYFAEINQIETKIQYGIQ